MRVVLEHDGCGSMAGLINPIRSRVPGSSPARHTDHCSFQVFGLVISCNLQVSHQCFMMSCICSCMCHRVQCMRVSGMYTCSVWHGVSFVVVSCHSVWFLRTKVCCVCSKSPVFLRHRFLPKFSNALRCYVDRCI